MSTIRISFTGTTNLHDSSFPILEDVIRMLREHSPTQFNSGAAYGVDTAAYELAVEFFPNLRHCLWVPAGKRHNKSIVDTAYKRDHEVYLVNGGYMARNDALVDNADMLVAFPFTPHEIKRSGTWATIRRARKRRIPVYIHPVG